MRPRRPSQPCSLTGSLYQFFPNIYWQHPRLLLPTLALAIGVLLWQVIVPQRTWRWLGPSVFVAVVGLLVAERVYTLLWKG